MQCMGERNINIQLLFHVTNHSLPAHIINSATVWLPKWLSGKASPANTQNTGWIPGLGRPPGEGNGNPPHYSCLGNPMDGGAWWATIHRVAKSQTELNNQTTTTMAHM